MSVCAAAAIRGDGSKTEELEEWLLAVLDTAGECLGHGERAQSGVWVYGDTGVVVS